MSRILLAVLLLLLPLITAAPSEERTSPPPDGFVEFYNSNSTEENVKPEQPEPESRPDEISKASAKPPQQRPPQILIPAPPSSIPFVIPRPFSIPFPQFAFAPPPPPPPFPQFPGLDVVQVIAIPRPQKNLQEADDDEDDGEEELVLPIEIPIDSQPEGRRAPFGSKDRKKKKQKKQKKQKKHKKQKKQKRPKQPLSYPPPPPVIIYQNQEESLGNDGTQPGMSGTQGAQSSYAGYYMVYVVEVRWTGNNYTQTVLTGRPVPAITIPTSTESGLVTNLSETIKPANLVNGPQPTPTCFYQRSTTTEHFGNQPEIIKPVDASATYPAGIDENNFNETPEEQEMVGEEEESDELDSVEEDDYDDDESDPKKKKSTKKQKEINVPTSSTDANQQ